LDFTSTDARKAELFSVKIQNMPSAGTEVGKVILKVLKLYSFNP